MRAFYAYSNLYRDTACLQKIMNGVDGLGRLSEGFYCARFIHDAIKISGSSINPIRLRSDRVNPVGCMHKMHQLQRFFID